MKVNVVDDLGVERLGAALEQQTDEGVALRVRRAVLFTLTDRADERRIPAVAGHEEGVGVGAAVEQCAGDRQRVVVRRGEREAGKAEIRQRLPALGADVPIEILRFADARSSGAGLGAVSRRQRRVAGEGLLHRGEIAADDLGLEAGVRDARIAFENSHGRVPCAHVRRCRPARDDRDRRSR